MNNEVKELAEFIAEATTKGAYSSKDLAQALIAAGYRKAVPDIERRERIAEIIWVDECERKDSIVSVKWKELPGWAHNVYLELADKIEALFPKPELEISQFLTNTQIAEWETLMSQVRFDSDSSINIASDKRRAILIRVDDFILAHDDQLTKDKGEK
jgi:hypothetical protein